MKKQLLKLTLLVAVFLTASTTSAQGIFWTKEGWYKIGARGTNLFMTINGSTGALEWAEEITSGDTSTQEWKIVDHRTPASGGLMEITAKAGGLDWTMCTAGVESDHPNYTITVELRLPKEIEYTPAPDENTDPVYSGDYSGLDQFQRRKAKVDANGDPDSAGANPADGNNALFIRTPWGTDSRYGVIPTAAGDPVKFDKGGIDVIDFHFVRDIETTASVNTFDVEAFTISNPVNNQLTIKGATAKVKELSLYSVLGNKVLSQSVNSNNQDLNLNVSGLSTGLYIVEMTGFNGERFTKKIIKQ